MDAWIRNLMKSVSSSSGGSTSRRDEPEILLCKRRSASPAVVVVAASATTPAAAAAVSTSAPRSAIAASSQVATSQQTPSPRTQHRIAHWDKKREKCKNCTLIYLKTLSRHPGFCSVDCKSNATYLDKVNRTIRAMKDAVEQRQQQQQQQDASAAEEPVVEVVAAAPAPAASSSPADDDDDAEDDGYDRAPHGAHTFSEFGLESRILDASNVEWAFSALY